MKLLQMTWKNYLFIILLLLVFWAIVSGCSGLKGRQNGNSPRKDRSKTR